MVTFVLTKSPVSTGVLQIDGVFGDATPVLIPGELPGDYYFVSLLHLDRWTILWS